MTLSTSSSAAHQKWKKSLAVFSKWAPRDKKLLATSPTVMAAATEKVIRHQRTTSLQAVKSEDLTASQFASYAGIKIQHDDDWDEENVDSDNDDDDDDDDDDEADDEVVPNASSTMILQSSVAPSMAGVPLARSCSDRGGTRNKSGLQIWDSEFWQQGTTTMHNNKTQMMKTTETNVMITKKESQPQPTSIMMAPARSYASTTSSTSTHSALSECSNMSSTNDVPQLVRSRPGVIRKGRFKIVLGSEEIDDENDEEKQRQGQHQSSFQPPVVEWRRKRSCTQ